MTELIKKFGILALVAIIVSLIMALVGMIGAVSLGNGCFERYSLDKEGHDTNSSDNITNTVMLNANANYTYIDVKQANGETKRMLDTGRYGDWLNTNLAVTKDQVVHFQIEGDISLCRAYLQPNSLPDKYLQADGKWVKFAQPNTDKDDSGNRIPIPRVEEVDMQPLSLLFDAKIDKWRNITEIFTNDKLIVSISPNYKLNANPVLSSPAVIYDVFSKQPLIADCAEKKPVGYNYSPICGRYSIYSGDYTSGCEKRDKYQAKKEGCCTCSSFSCNVACHASFGVLDSCCKDQCYTFADAWHTIKRQAPEPYEDGGRFTSPWFNPCDLPGLASNYFTRSCSNERGTTTTSDQQSDTNSDFAASDDKIKMEQEGYKDKKYFWFSADTATGLLSQISLSDGNDKVNSSGANYVKIADDQTPYDYYNNINKKYNIILNMPQAPAAADGKTKSFLKYGFYQQANADSSKNTGGYVLNIKHTKCRRSNGNNFLDSEVDRGKVQYKIIPFTDNPLNTSVKPTSITPDNKEGEANITSDGTGYLWMRISNAQADYIDSTGSYRVKFFISEKIGSFTINVINPLFELLKTKIKAAAIKVFASMTCYNGDPNLNVNGDPNGDYKITSCTNFFHYIKAMLIVYIITYGMMFSLGMVKIKQDDLLIRIIKVAMVAGLINHQTFNFFNEYIFDAVTGFSDEIMSHMSGYSLFSSSDKISNPFMFLDALMSKIFFSKTFMSQLLSLIAMGLNGLIYFILIFISLAIVIITLLRAVAVYIMAFMAIAVLIGLAPLFLTFMLFDVTRYLFDNWIRFTIRYMIEPVILMAGIIILTQLYTIFLDYATGFSVCWKCVLPLKIPFPNIPGLEKFTNMPIFCINWFAPWGMDPSTGIMGINMQHIITLIILSYAMYGYVDFSGKMVAKLTNTSGPSATAMGESMSSAVEQKVLKKVGLDAEGRKAIQDKAEGRLTDRSKAIDEGKKNRPGGKEDSKPDELNKSDEPGKFDEAEKSDDEKPSSPKE